MDRGERRRRSWVKFQRRLKVDQNQHYSDTTCPCWVPGKGQARFKDTPCKRSYLYYEFNGGWEYALPRDQRRALPEVCTTRNPWKGSGKARKRNVRYFPRNISCMRCGQLLLIVPAEQVSLPLFREWEWRRKNPCEYCTKQDKKRAKALLRAA